MIGLENKLVNSDFFDAPATTKYAYSYSGGLCQYCLDFYYNLCNLNKVLHLNLNEDSIKIVGLFNNIYKINYYKESSINVKEYREDGTKHDNLGNFEWVAERCFKIKEASLKNDISL